MSALRFARRLRGFTILECMLAVVAGSLLAAVLGRVLLDVVYTVRLAAESDARARAVAALARQLRGDARAARASQTEQRIVHDRILPIVRLSIYLADAWQEVEYVVAPDGVERRAGGAITHAWHATRLDFELGFQRGPSEKLAIIRCVESPPPRARGLDPRRYELCVTLPIPRTGEEHLDPRETVP